MAYKQTTAEQRMGRFNSPRQAQRFLSVHDQNTTIFRPKRHRAIKKGHFANNEPSALNEIAFANGLFKEAS